jgi:IclR family KDG regulon transcriptional repressor
MNDNKYPVKSLIKAVTILEFLGASSKGESLTTISEHLKIGKSTVHRLLATLRDHDLVWLDPISSNYILGAKILKWGDQLSRQSLLIRYGEAVLLHLANETNETCNLGVLEGDQTLYLIKKESQNTLRMSGQVGKRLPAHCTALGKVLLAGLTPEELAQLYGKRSKLETPTANSIAVVSDLLAHLDKVRLTGLAFDTEELYPGVVCLAAPVRDYRARIIAAISVSFPRHRIDPEKLEEFKRHLIARAYDLSCQLGYEPGEASGVPA